MPLLLLRLLLQLLLRHVLVVPPWCCGNLLLLLQGLQGMRRTGLPATCLRLLLLVLLPARPLLLLLLRCRRRRNGRTGCAKRGRRLGPTGRRSGSFGSGGRSGSSGVMLGDSLRNISLVIVVEAPWPSLPVRVGEHTHAPGQGGEVGRARPTERSPQTREGRGPGLRRENVRGQVQGMRKV